MTYTPYTGADHQPVQTGVVNQMGTALPGDLAFPAEPNLLDMCPMGESDGVVCGRFIALRKVSSLWSTGLTPPQRTGISNMGVVSLTHGDVANDDGTVSAAAATDVSGVLRRSNSVRTNSDGLPIVAYNEIATVLRKGANGRRAWVDCGPLKIAAGATAYVVTVQDTAKLYQVGQLVDSTVTDAGLTKLDISTLLNVISPGVLAYTTAAGVAHYMAMIEFI